MWKPERIGEDGWRLVRLRLRSAAPKSFETLVKLFAGSIEESSEAAGVIV